MELHKCRFLSSGNSIAALSHVLQCHKIHSNYFACTVVCHNIVISNVLEYNNYCYPQAIINGSQAIKLLIVYAVIKISLYYYLLFLTRNELVRVLCNSYLSIACTRRNCNCIISISTPFTLEVSNRQYYSLFNVPVIIGIYRMIHA